MALNNILPAVMAAANNILGTAGANGSAVPVNPPVTPVGPVAPINPVPVAPVEPVAPVVPTPTPVAPVVPTPSATEPAKITSVETHYKVTSPTGRLNVDSSKGDIRIILPSLYATTQDNKEPLVITKTSNDKNMVVLVTADGTHVNEGGKEYNLLGSEATGEIYRLSFDGESWNVVL
ncbi:MAG: hypothetical protein Solumvirus6_7 [Solumvirus sp.]|uniref:Uncharacterized protein n=1 Tax=Solumvirus sp. TaxID=2487773 RepID=A0A3G5AGR2_9VIRU|nr:MAG: hypothetical protein Solumvirus6_7 [Solumvirus sp.]